MNETSFLKKIVEIESVSGNEQELAEFLKNELNELGFKTEMDSVGNVIAITGNSINPVRRVLFCGHMDTVSGKIPVKIENNFLFGRGSVDAKGALAAFIFGIKNAMHSLENIEVILACVVEEEALSRGAKNILNEFNPNFVVIGEPSGFNAITVGYKGSIIIEVELIEKCFHKSFERNGAIEQGIAFWNKVNAYCNEFNKGKNLFDSLNAFIRSINSESNGLNESIKMQIQFRVPLEINETKLKEFLLKINENANISFIESIPAHRPSKANELVSAFNSGIKSIKEKTVFKLKTGTSDFNILGTHYKKPIIAFGPGDSKLDHTPNECINLNEFSKSIKVISNALIKINDNSLAKEQRQSIRLKPLKAVL